MDCRSAGPDSFYDVMRPGFKRDHADFQSCNSLFVNVQDGKEGLLRYFDAANLLHALLALFLLFE